MPSAKPRGEAARAARTTPRKRAAAGPAVDRHRRRLAGLEAEIDAAIRAARDGRTLDAWRERVRAWIATDLPGLVARFDEIRGSERADEFGLDPAFIDLVSPLFLFLYRVWWRVETKGLDAVPDRGSALIVANHAGAFFPYDAAMLKVALRTEHRAARELRPLADDFVFRAPFLASLLSRVGGVRACPENAERLLRRGEIVGVFPEGVRGMAKSFRERYRLRRFGRGGFIELALRTGAPIIPTAVVGAEEVHPLLGTWQWPARWLGLPYFPLTPTFPWLGPLGVIPLPSKWIIRFGAPIALAERYDAKDASDPVLVDTLTEEVRETIESMLDEELVARGSAFFGTLRGSRSRAPRGGR